MFETHIKPLVAGDFKVCEDGKWRIHMHGVLRSEHEIQPSKVKGVWRKGEYGFRQWKNYKPWKRGIAYCMDRHKTVYWKHPACPLKHGKCKGKKGCYHARRGTNDLLLQLPSASSTSRYGGGEGGRND